MKRFFVICFTALLSTAAFILDSCQSTKSSTASKMLKFDFEKGRGYDYEMIVNMDQEIMGQEIQMDITSFYSMQVEADDGENKTISATYDRFKMKMGMAGLNLEIDTDEPLPGFGGGEEKEGMEMLNGLLGAIKGKKFSMQVNPEGKVLKISGFEEMVKSIADSMRLEGEKREEAMSEFNKQLNEQSIKEQFERVWYIFPNKEVKVGDSWQKQSTTSGLTGGNYTSTYTVKEIEGDMVTLDEKSKIEGSENDIGLKGEVTGTLIIDSRSGLVVSASQDMTITASKEGSSIDIKAKTKIKGQARN